MMCDAYLQPRRNVSSSHTKHVCKQELGYRAMQADLALGNAFDVTRPAGFVWLSCNSLLDP